MREMTRVRRQKFVQKVFTLLEDTGMSHTDARHYMALETGIKIAGVAKWANGRVVPREPAWTKLVMLNRSLIREAKGSRSLGPVIKPKRLRGEPNGRVPVSEAMREVTSLRAIFEIAKVSLSKSDRMALANMLMVEYLAEDGGEIGEV